LMFQFLKYTGLFLLLVPLCVVSAQDNASLDAAFGALTTYDYGRDSNRLVELAEYVRSHLRSQNEIAELETRFIKVLQSGASPASKQFSAQQLSLIGTGRSVPALVALLGQPQFADDALYALQRMPGEEVDKALLKELKSSGDRARLGIINVLGNRRTNTASSALAKIALERDEEASVAAMAALGRTGGSDAQKVLLKLLQESAGGKKAAAALLVLADGLLRSGDKKNAGEVYLRVFEDTQGPPRYAALDGQVRSGNGAAAKNVLSALKSEDWGLVSAAVHLVPAIPEDPAFTRALCEALPDAPPLTRSALILAIADRGDPDTLPYLKKELTHSDESVRFAALQALSRLPDTGNVDLLVDHALATNGTEQAAARQSLDTMQGAAIDAKIQSGIREQGGRKQAELVRSAGARGIIAAKSTLFELAAGPDGRARVAAIDALQNVCSAEDLPALIDIMLTADTDTERQQALQSASVVALQEPDENKQARVILDALPKASDPKAKGLLLQVLGRIGNVNGLPVLKNALHDKNADIRVAAIKALGEWPNRAPAGDLLTIARTSGQQLERVLALRSYIKLAGIRSERRDEEAVEMYQTAIGLANNVNEKRLVLSGLSTLPALGSLQLAAEYLTDPELKEEAEVAVVELTSGPVGWRFSQESMALLEKIARTTVSDLTRKNAQERIDNLRSR
jgi:HEAT repeat protein